VGHCGIHGAERSAAGIIEGAVFFNNEWTDQIIGFSLPGKAGSESSLHE
jgi:hypothetical protein